MYSPDSSTTGGTMTGFTTPAFGIVAVLAPAWNAIRRLITSVSGTGTSGVDVASATKPFESVFYTPSNIRSSPVPNPISGKYPPIPVNQYRLVTKKGGDVNADGVVATMVVKTSIDVPAGMEIADPDQVKAALSYHIGHLSENSVGIYETVTAGAA